MLVFHLALLVCVALLSCGNDNGIGPKCQALAADHYDVNAYLTWDASTISSRSSKTHHLPCKAYFEDDDLVFSDCPESERKQYYELIGKSDQFVAGWVDVTDRTGTRVETTEVDSVENFNSEFRLEYVEKCQ